MFFLFILQKKAPQPAETVSAHCGSHNVRAKYPQHSVRERFLDGREVHSAAGPHTAGIVPAACGNNSRMLRERLRSQWKRFPHTAEAATCGKVPAACGNASRILRNRFPQAAGTLSAHCGNCFRRQRKRFPHDAENCSRSVRIRLKHCLLELLLHLLYN